jgi:hypothetical protein
MTLTFLIFALPLLTHGRYEGSIHLLNVDLSSQLQVPEIERNQSISVSLLLCAYKMREETNKFKNVNRKL